MVNGKSVEQILKELETGAKRSKKLGNKYEYYSIEQYEDRLNEVVGRSNWRAHYESVGTTMFPNGQCLIEKKCTIIFLDENGIEALSAEGFGGAEVERHKDNGSYLFLGNQPGNAKIAAFKDALRSLNIFGIHSTETSSTAPAQAKSEDQSAKPDTRMSFLTEGEMVTAYEDQTTGKPVYRLAAHEVVGKCCREKTCDIVFYPNQYKKCVDQLNALIAETKEKPKLVALTVKEAVARDGVSQFVFKGFA